MKYNQIIKTDFEFLFWLRYFLWQRKLIVYKYNYSIFSQSALFCLSPHLVNISKQDLYTEFKYYSAQPTSLSVLQTLTMTRSRPFSDEEGGVFKEIWENLEIFTKKGQTISIIHIQYQGTFVTKWSYNIRFRIHSKKTSSLFKFKNVCKIKTNFMIIWLTEWVTSATTNNI